MASTSLRTFAPGTFTPVAATIAAVHTAQSGRARAGGGAVVIVATVQSLAILALLRGVGGSAEQASRAAVVSGAVLTVVAFIAWNLLAQRLSALKSAGGLDFYGTLPVRPTAVVLGFCTCYATFAVPGVVVTAVAGTALFGLPVAPLWVLLPAVLTSAITFGGLGALSGLAPARPETATLAGQFGLTAVMFVGLIPPQSLPDWSSPIRAAVPIAYDIDAFASALTPHPDWTAIALRLTGSAVFGACCLALAARAYRTAMNR
ncbi:MULTISPECIES: ABC transporter permease [Actinomadura]|uniref:ABC-2 type transport system permease protein n=1 Tax=Actinomadura madurae TaxID=1993 RepID=A0A1I5P9Y9_9ACTN|nr:ABC transporter permease [Actinomadura madurae]SFP30757.1 ABC-2 type transport system permease protein [Actinomadura madurae]